MREKLVYNLATLHENLCLISTKMKKKNRLSADGADIDAAAVVVVVVVVVVYVCKGIVFGLLGKM